MTATTIKVSADLRDQLKDQARRHGRTLGEHLSALAAEEDRRERFTSVRRAMADCPIDAEYETEAREWLSDAWS